VGFSELICARGKPGADWKKDLQICGAGIKLRKRSTRVVGKKPNGKYQLNMRSMRSELATKISGKINPFPGGDGRRYGFFKSI
jgi:hypothetical protein